MLPLVNSPITRGNIRNLKPWSVIEKTRDTRSSWLNCALRGDEAVYWVGIGQQWLVLGGTESAYWRFQFVIAGKGPV